MYQFTEEQFAKIESKINKMGELLFEIGEDLQEFGFNKVDIHNIPFLGDLNTSLSMQVEGLPEYISDRTFEHWKEKKVEITKLEDTFLYIIPKASNQYPKGTEIKIPGKVNFGSGIVAPFPAIILDDELIERIFVKDSDGKEINVCLGCYEGLISDGDCLACGIMNVNGQFQKEFSEMSRILVCGDIHGDSCNIAMRIFKISV